MKKYTVFVVFLGVFGLIAMEDQSMEMDEGEEQNTLIAHADKQVMDLITRQAHVLSIRNRLLERRKTKGEDVEKELQDLQKAKKDYENHVLTMKNFNKSDQSHYEFIDEQKPT